MSAAAAPEASSSNGSNLGKRARDAETDNGDAQNGNDEAASDSDDDDLGPMPMPATAEDVGEGPSAGPSSSKATAAKKRKILKHERVFLEIVPSADRYYSKVPPMLGSCVD